MLKRTATGSTGMQSTMLATFTTIHHYTFVYIYIEDQSMTATAALVFRTSVHI